MKRLYLALVSLVLGAATAGTPPEGTAAPGLGDVRATVEKWVATQQLIDSERQAWQQQREVLNSRIDLLDSEIATYEAKLAEAGAKVEEGRDKSRAIDAERRILVDTADQLARDVTELEAGLKRLARRVPDTLQEKVAPLLQRIPENPETTTVSVAERYQNVLGVLSELQRLNNEISVNTEIRPLGEGKLVQVTTVYLGLGQAYYAAASGEAGIGRPGPDGWIWEPAASASREIVELLDIVQSKGSPKFVALPVEIN
jgi:septal ring factor EnvC (AmiA/AmiB activator)